MIKLLKLKNNKYNLSKGIDYITSKIKKRYTNKIKLANELRILAKESYHSYPKEALDIMRESNELDSNVSKIKWIGFRLYELGDVIESYEMLKSVPKDCFVSNSEKRAFRKLQDEYNYQKMIKEEREKIREFQNVDTISQETNSAMEWYRQVKQLMKNTRNPSSQRFYNPSDKIIAIICDEYFLNSVQPSAKFIYITPSCNNDFIDNYSDISLFLFVSTFLGKENSWYGVNFRTADYTFNDKRARALDIISLFKKRGIPTVFYFVDAPKYDIDFMDFAKLSDYIYTVNSQSISFIRKNCPNSKCVEYLPFGVNPLTFNPIAADWSSNNVSIFECSSENEVNQYYNDFKAFKTIFLNVNDSCDLNVIRKDIINNFNFKEIVNIYKNSRWCVNELGHTNPDRINSIEYEGRACGCLIISSINNKNFISPFCVLDKNGIEQCLEFFNGEALYETKLFGVRNIFSNYTSFDLINKILSNANLAGESKTPRVLVIGNNSKFVQDCFNRQTYKNKQFISLEQVTVDVDLVGFEIVTYFSDNIFYGNYYLEDMINAFKYSDADFITKLSYENQQSDGTKVRVEGIENNFVDKFDDIALTLFWSKSISMEFILSIINNSGKITNKGSALIGYSTDHWSVVKNYKCICKNNIRYRLSIVISIKNNDISFYCRSFLSIRALSIFDCTEIILVYSSSDNEDVLTLINYLSNTYSNVKTCFHENSSCSLLRNYGIDIATGEYIIFLDDNDCCLNDGFSTIINVTDNEDYNVIIANSAEFDKNNIKTYNSYNYFRNIFNTDSFITKDGLSSSSIDFGMIKLNSIVFFTKYLKDQNFCFVDSSDNRTEFVMNILSKINYVKIVDLVPVLSTNNIIE